MHEYSTAEEQLHASPHSPHNYTHKSIVYSLHSSTRTSVHRSRITNIGDRGRIASSLLVLGPAFASLRSFFFIFAGSSWRKFSKFRSFLSAREILKKVQIQVKCIVATDDEWVAVITAFHVTQFFEISLWSYLKCFIQFF